MSWTPDGLEHLRRAHELEVATPGRDGVLRPCVPVWLVVVDDRLYVRTWYRSVAAMVADEAAAITLRLDPAPPGISRLT